VTGVKVFSARVAGFICLLAATWMAVLFIASNAPAPVQGFFRRFTSLAVGDWPSGGFSAKRFAEMKQASDLDVLFAGSSHCYRTFDTRFFRSRGLKTFNMGSTAQTPLNTYFLLKQHIARLKPKLLIIEVYPGILGVDGTESFLDLLTNIRPTRDLVSMALAIRSVRVMNALFARMMRIGESGPAVSVRSGARHERYIEGGFVERTDAAGGTREGRMKPVTISDEQLDYLRKVVELAREQGGRAAFVVQPLPGDTVGGAKGLDDALAVVARFAAGLKVPLFDYVTRGVMRDRRYYFDYHHLSREGVRVFDEMFYRDLTNAGLTPDG